MSDGMQAVAGKTLRWLISFATSNRFVAVIVGMLITCLIQSSSITTVMVVGFVNSGIMNLTQAIGVIMGANIGTTITGIIIALKIGKYGLPIMGAAVFFYIFSKSDRWRFWAMVFVGIGMVFVGLGIMKDACSIIKSQESFKDWFQQFTADNYFGVLKCALAGCILTFLVQSSSATLGITISLAVSGVISFPTAAALVLGENIGTTITAFLASIGAKTNAKRAAYFHIIFNILGVFWISLIFSWYIGLIQTIVGGNVDNLVVGENGQESFPNRTLAIALTHSIFNITNTLAFLAFVPFFAKLLTRIVPGEELSESGELTNLDVRLFETPVLAIEQSGKEIDKMNEECITMLDWLATLVQQAKPDKTLADKLAHRENVLDKMQDSISEFVTHLLAGNIPVSVAEEARQQIRIADELESISDQILNLDKFDRKLRRAEARFTDEQQESLIKLNHSLSQYLSDVKMAKTTSNQDLLIQTEQNSKRIKSLIKKLRKDHLEDLSSGSNSPQVNIAYMACLTSFSQIRDHIDNVVEAYAELDAQ